MKTPILAASLLVLAAAAPAWAQSTTSGTMAPSTAAPSATAPAGSSATPAKKTHGTTGTSASHKRMRSHNENARMKREMERQSSPATGHKNAATDADTAHLNQQELGRISQ